jgi:hypothetical protein
VAETCVWLLYNKFIFIHSSAFVGPLKNNIIIHIIEFLSPESEHVSFLMGIYARNKRDLGAFYASLFGASRGRYVYLLNVRTGSICTARSTPML